MYTWARAEVFAFIVFAVPSEIQQAYRHAHTHAFALTISHIHTRGHDDNDNSDDKNLGCRRGAEDSDRCCSPRIRVMKSLCTIL